MELSSEKKKIDYRFKILYALGIIMVVCGHANEGGISIVSDWFPYRGLHLALFVFCSGYFFKPSSEENIGKYLLKKVKTLIVPLYIYNFVYGVFVLILRFKGFEIGGDFTITNLLLMPITSGHQFGYNLGGWFVMPLFMVEILNIIIRKALHCINKTIPEHFFFIISLVLGLAGNALACHDLNSGWWLVLVRMLYFVPFYGMGIYYKCFLEKYEKRIPGIWFFGVIFLTKLIIVCVYGKMPIYVPSWCQNFTEGPVMPILIGYLGIAFWLRVAAIVEPVIGRNKYINLIADNTYSIMMNQFVGFMVVNTIYGFLNKVTPLFNHFDWIKYKTNVFYFYMPRNISHTLILYLLAGLIVPILIQKMIDKIKNWLYSYIRPHSLPQG